MVTLQSPIIYVTRNYSDTQIRTEQARGILSPQDLLHIKISYDGTQNPNSNMMRMCLIRYPMSSL